MVSQILRYHIFLPPKAPGFLTKSSYEREARVINDTASCARAYQHDVRAKQARACDAERAGFRAPIFILVTSPACWRVITHASNYSNTDGQLKLTYRMPRRGISSSQSWKTRLKIGRQVSPPVDNNLETRVCLHSCMTVRAKPEP